MAAAWVGRRTGVTLVKQQGCHSVGWLEGFVNQAVASMQQDLHSPSHAPCFVTFTPRQAAKQAVSWVLPSLPHTGAAGCPVHCEQGGLVVLVLLLPPPPAVGTPTQQISGPSLLPLHVSLQSYSQLTTAVTSRGHK